MSTRKRKTPPNYKELSGSVQRQKKDRREVAEKISTTKENGSDPKVEEKRVGESSTVRIKTCNSGETSKIAIEPTVAAELPVDIGEGGGKFARSVSPVANAAHKQRQGGEVEDEESVVGGVERDENVESSDTSSSEVEEEEEEKGREERKNSVMKNKAKHWSVEEYDALLEAETAIYRGYRTVGENCFNVKIPVEKILSEQDEDIEKVSKLIVFISLKKLY
tara:strand:- start:273 stop:935 length:663 start_codon:yes stop_codon:yes gene_type:complete